MFKFKAILIALILLTALKSYGFIGDSAETLNSKEFAVGALFNIDTKKRFSTVATFQAGFVKRFNMIVRLGGQSDQDKKFNFYGGLEFKILIADFFGGTDKMALVIGGHYNGGFKDKHGAAVDISFSFSNRFKIFQIFVGLDTDLIFASEFMYPMKLAIGLKISLKKLNLIAEIDFPLLYDEYGYSAYVFGTGISYNF